MAFSYNIFADNPEEGATKGPESGGAAEDMMAPTDATNSLYDPALGMPTGGGLDDELMGVEAPATGFDANSPDSVAPSSFAPPTLADDDDDPFGNGMAAPLPEGEEVDKDAPWVSSMLVGGESYATTLFWQPLQDPDNPLPEIRETAENVLDNSDLYVIRPTGMPQYGLGISSEGHKPGMAVAALALVEAFSDVPSSVSVFKVPEGWWFIAIRNDLILPEDDMLYEKEEDAKKAFLSMMAVPDWGRKIAPAEWGIPGTETTNLEFILTRATPVRLVKLKKEFNVKLIAIAAVVIILLAWGGFALLSHFFGGTEKIQEVIAPPSVIKPIIEKPKVVSIPMPWESLMVPTEFMDACVNSTMKLVAAKVPGWTMGDVTCQSTGLTTSWTMQSGRLANLQTALKLYNIDDLNFTISDSGRDAMGSIKFAITKNAYSAPKMRAREIMIDLTDIFQALNIPLAVSISNVDPAIDPARPDAPKQDPYSYVNFTFSSNLPTSEWTSLFSRFDALELTNMTYNINSNTWKYEGRIYGKN